MAPINRNLPVGRPVKDCWPTVEVLAAALAPVNAVTTSTTTKASNGRRRKRFTVGPSLSIRETALLRET